MGRGCLGQGKCGWCTSEVSVEVMEPSNLAFEFVPHRFVQRLSLGGRLDQALVGFRDSLKFFLKLKERNSVEVEPLTFSPMTWLYWFLDVPSVKAVSSTQPFCTSSLASKSYSRLHPNVSPRATLGSCEWQSQVWWDHLMSPGTSGVSQYNVHQMSIRKGWI